MRYRVLLAVFAIISILSLPAVGQRFSTGARVTGGARISSGARFSGAIGMRSHAGIGVRTGVAFGHNPRFSVFVNTRPHYYRPHYSYRRYAYPYVVYPYPLSYYGAYDFLGYDSYSEPQTVYVPYSVYTNTAEIGLDTQMRQQQLGVYAQPRASNDYPSRAPGVDNSKPYPQRAPVTSASEPEQPATLLVYRDGHSAEVRNYAVVGSTLWIFSEDRAQKVALSLLDMDATRKANEERGVDFPVR